MEGAVPELKEDLREFARSHFPEFFTGFSIEWSTIVVHRIPSPGLPLDAALRERFPEQKLRFADTSRNEVELTALVDRILGELDFWRSRGIRIICFGPDAIAGVVKIGIRETEAAAIAEVQARYGDAAVVTGGVLPGVAGPYRERARH